MQQVNALCIKFRAVKIYSRWYIYLSFGFKRLSSGISSTSEAVFVQPCLGLLQVISGTYSALEVVIPP
jgi:hypothetical protein